MEDIAFIKVFLLAQMLGLCVYKLTDKLGPWAIGCGVLTPPITFVLVLCARWSQDQPTGVAPNSGEELLSFFFGSFFWTVTLLFGVIVNLTGAMILIFLARKLFPASSPSSLEK